MDLVEWAGGGWRGRRGRTLWCSESIGPAGVRAHSRSRKSGGHLEQSNIR